MLDFFNIFFCPTLRLVGRFFIAHKPKIASQQATEKNSEFNIGKKNAQIYFTFIKEEQYTRKIELKRRLKCDSREW